jgi:UDP-N-acetylmuramoyl-tripeptide--D-alanyl-D-alanine ligase
MFDLDHIARIVGGKILESAKNCQVDDVSTDSRNISAGALFVPLRGERFDGHDYLSQAVKNGAVACLSEEVVAGLTVPVVQVDNTLKALGDIAAAYRMQLNGPLVAITGSAGKTTTKEMLAGVLGLAGTGLKTAGNFNNLIGLPLTLLQVKKEHQWAVLEMGTSALGEIERLTEIAQPTVGVITNVGAAHLETLVGLDGVARAKGELLAGLQGGSAIVNLDDPRVSVLPIANGVKKVTYGLSENADVRAENIVEEDGNVHFDLLVKGQKQKVTLAVPGRHNVLNALAAATAALELSVSMDDVVRGLNAFVAVPGRMSLFPLACGGLLLDDSYNSNPLSATAALDALRTLKGQGRRIAVLGDMLELGDGSEMMHQELGAKSAAIVDVLIAVGHFADKLAQGAEAAGLSGDQTICLSCADDAISYLQKYQRSGDRILVKGSRGVRLDLVSEALIKANNNADNRQEN